MKICLAGDSWAWTCWGHEWQSKTLQQQNQILIPNGEKYSLSAYPHLEHVLERAGHQVVYAAKPGGANLETCTWLESLDVDVDIIWCFFTHPLRDTIHMPNLVEFDSLDIDTYAKVYSEYRVHALKKFDEVADKIRKPILLLGGCGKIYPEEFRRICQSPFIHLVSPSIMEQYTDYRHNDYYMGPWEKFADGYDLKCLEFIEHVIDHLIPYCELERLFWPDNAHPGITGQTLIADMCFKYMEDHDLI